MNGCYRAPERSKSKTSTLEQFFAQRSSEFEGAFLSFYLHSALMYTGRPSYVQHGKGDSADAQAMGPESF